jgi:hypothetical protein
VQPLIEIRIRIEGSIEWKMGKRGAILVDFDEYGLFFILLLFETDAFNHTDGKRKQIKKKEKQFG